MNDQEKAKSIERANSYRTMMDMWAWKDFELRMQELRAKSLEGMLNASTIEDVQIKKGFVKCIDALKADIGYVLGNVG